MFVDDLPVPDGLRLAVLRSPWPHARINSIDWSEAANKRGVAAVVTAQTLGPSNGPFPNPLWRPNPALNSAIAADVKPETIQLLAGEMVRYVGDPVAAVLANDAYVARDALDSIQVDYEPLPSVAEAEAAMAAGAPLIRPTWDSNLAASFRLEKGNSSVAFAEAAHVVRGTFTVGRQGGSPIEPRGVVAQPTEQGIRVWSATQNPHWLRDALCTVLDLAADAIHVSTPHVGGGFGLKSMVYPEELLTAYAARLTGRPVKWIETRSEHLMCAVQSRDQVHHIAMALTADGRILALEDRFLVNLGASSILPLSDAYNTAVHLCGPYRVPSVSITAACVVTNKVPAAPMRGTGRPEATFAMERILDLAGAAIGMDRAELRRRNILRAADMPYEVGLPYRDAAPIVLDGGDYGGNLDRALEAIDYEGAVVEQRLARHQGVFRGIGIAAYVEGTGLGPGETVRCRLERDGTVTVMVPNPSQGQGHATTLAQIGADSLGIPPSRIRVFQGDTTHVGAGMGTIASRSAVVLGNGVAEAASQLREKILHVTGTQPGLASDWRLLADLRRATPDRRWNSLRHVAQVLATQESGKQPGPLLDVSRTFTPSTVTWSNGVHAAIVDVDPDTGVVRIRRYVVVHDCGRHLNPMIVDGQIRGGVALGIGGALLEEVFYTATAQPQTRSLAEYGLPRAADLPSIEVISVETPSPGNPLGVRGVGEGGPIPVAATLASAVEDALRPLGVLVTSVPLTPSKVWHLIAERAAT